MDRSGKQALAAVVLLSATVFAQTSERMLTKETQLTGTVRGMPPRTGCEVELSNVNGYSTVQEAMCDVNGSFQFMEVPRGDYNLIVKMGTNQYTEEVSLEAPREEVDVDIPAVKPKDGNRNTVSVAEMRIPDQAKNDLLKANNELAKGKLDKADELTEKALVTAPQFARAITLRAVIMMAKNDFNSALTLAENSAKLDPTLGLTQVVMASALNSMGRAKEAQAAAEQGVRLDGSWQGHYELARALMTQHHFKRGLAEITKATAVAPPNFGELMLLRASALMNLKDMNGAKEALTAFMKQRPGDPRGAKLMTMLEAR